MFDFDIRTLSFISIASSLLLAFGLQLVSRVYSQEPSLRLWAMGAAVYAAGQLLFALRAFAPALSWVLVAGNVLLLTGASFFYLGNRAFRGLQPQFPWYWILTAATTVALVYYTFLVPSLAARIVVMSVASAAILYASAAVLLRSGDRPDLMTRRFVGGGLLAAALFMGVRALTTPFAPLAGDDISKLTGPLHTLPFALAIGLGTVLAVGLPLLILGRIRQRLSQDEMQLNAILESAVEGVLAVDREGKVLRANSRFAQMWRIPTVLLASNNDQALLEHVLEQLSDPDAFMRKVRTLYQSTDDSTDTLHFKDGRVFERNSSPLALEGTIRGRVWTFQDVTERERAEAALRANEARFRSLTQLGADWYWEQDEQFRFTEMSVGPGFPANISPQDHIGKRRWELDYVDMSEAQWQRHREQLERHEPFRDFELRRLDRNGNVCFVSISGEPIFDERGRFKGYHGVGRDITQRRHAEERLRASEQKFAKAFRSSPEFIAISRLADGRYVDVNEAYERTTGYAREEVLGRSAVEIGLWVDVDERRRLAGLVRLQGRVRDFEVRFRRKSGEIMQCRLSAELLEIDGVQCMLSVTQDITQRREAAEKLRASEERFRDLTRLSSDWFWEQDAQFRFTSMSEDWSDKAQFDLAGTIGKTRWELPIVGISQAQWAEHRALLERHEAFTKFVYQLRNSRGELRWFSINGKPVFGTDGTFLGYRGVGRDITEELSLERKARQSQKLEAIGRLAGGIAHDFNNILAAILGNERLARADLPADAPALASLREIEKSARRAQDLISQLLTFGLPQDAQRIALDPAAAVGDALRLLRATLPAMVQIRVSYEPDLPAILANAPAISQIVMSLGTNAAEAMTGAGTISVTVKTVPGLSLPAAAAPALAATRYVCIIVRDTGAGMDAQLREHVFEPFFTTKSAEKGTGMGLSVVRGIVRDLNGAITVESEPGRGATFYVYFPACTAPPASITPPAVETPAARARNSVRILFVDDEDSLVVLSQRLLERMGYQVRGFQDPSDAFAAFAQTPQEFDVLITDLAMPHMNGLELAERVLAIRPGLPVIVMSGHIREHDKRRAQDLGIRDLYWKPNTVEDLAQVLHQRISESSLGA